MRLGTVNAARMLIRHFTRWRNGPKRRYYVQLLRERQAMDGGDSPLMRVYRERVAELEREARELGRDRRTTQEQPGCSTPPQNSNGFSA